MSIDLGQRAPPRPPGRVVGAQVRTRLPELPRAVLQSRGEFQRWQRRAGNRRLAVTLLFSLLAHALFLKVAFGGEGWLPGLGFPWQERRVEAPDLRVVLVPVQPPVEPVVTPPPEPTPPLRMERKMTVRHAAPPQSEPSPPMSSPTPQPATVPVVPEVAARPQVALAAVPAQLPASAERAGETAPSLDSPPVVIVPVHTEKSTWVVPVPPPLPAPVADSQPREIALAEVQEIARAEASRLESERAEASRQEAARQEAARQEAARQEAARQEAARQEAARQETARQETARQEAARQEAARREAEAVRAAAIAQEEAKREAARRAIGRQLDEEAARRRELDVARAPPVPAEAVHPGAVPAAATPEAERREAALRAIGRQLDEEAARRDAAVAARQSSPQGPMYTGPRRYRLFGRADPNAVIARYAENWSRKIELNMTADIVREVAKQPHTNPLVNVAVRSDGSVESVTFVVSSGVPAIDEAVRRVVEGQAPYQVFPPALALLYDVIEIRRTWHFDVAIRLD